MDFARHVTPLLRTAAPGRIRANMAFHNSRLTLIHPEPSDDFHAVSVQRIGEAHASIFDSVTSPTACMPLEFRHGGGYREEALQFSLFQVLCGPSG
jgi:hypothetical protein